MSADCFFIAEPKPKIALIYCFPMNGHQGFAPLSLEFNNSYARNPPGLGHETIIVCNGATITDPSKDLFNALPNRSYFDHDNSGWDIGGFQAAARAATADMLVFCAVHTYFRKPGWLARMHEVYCELGDTLYGSTGNQGDPRVGVHAHVRTTGFWCSRALFNSYPHLVTQGGGGGQRYAFEHGPDCLTSWVIRQGKTPWIVGWSQVWPVQQCDSFGNGFHQNDQAEVLVGDRLCCPPYYHTP